MPEVNTVRAFCVKAQKEVAYCKSKLKVKALTGVSEL